MCRFVLFSYTTDDLYPQNENEWNKANDDKEPDNRLRQGINSSPYP